MRTTMECNIFSEKSTNHLKSEQRISKQQVRSLSTYLKLIICRGIRRENVFLLFLYFSGPEEADELFSCLNIQYTTLTIQFSTIKDKYSSETTTITNRDRKELHENLNSSSSYQDMMATMGINSNSLGFGSKKKSLQASILVVYDMWT